MSTLIDAALLVGWSCDVPAPHITRAVSPVVPVMQARPSWYPLRYVDRIIAIPQSRDPVTHRTVSSCQPRSLRDLNSCSKIDIGLTGRKRATILHRDIHHGTAGHERFRVAWHDAAAGVVGRQRGQHRDGAPAGTGEHVRLPGQDHTAGAQWDGKVSRVRSPRECRCRRLTSHS